MNGSADRPDLAGLADAFLDGDIEAPAWQALIAEHGDSLQRAVDRAQSIRGALSGLPRPALPTALRESLIRIPDPQAVTRSKAPLHLWTWALPIAIAAVLMAAVLLNPEPATPTRAHPSVSRARPANPAAEDTKPAPSGGAAALSSGMPAPAPASQGADVGSVSAEASQATAMPAVMPTAIPVAKAATAADRPVVARREKDSRRDAGEQLRQEAEDLVFQAPEPLALALTWQIEAARKHPEANRSSFARERLADATEAGAPSAPQPAMARAVEPAREAAALTDTADANPQPLEAAPARGMIMGATDEKAEVNQAAAAFGEAPPAPAGGTSGPWLQMRLTNGSDIPLVLDPARLRLIGVDTSGRQLWRQPVVSGLTTIPAGLPLDIPVTLEALPPEVTHLRLEYDGIRSADLPVPDRE